MIVIMPLYVDVYHGRKKLTLLVGKDIITNAKQYTKRHKITLSRLVTQMLARLTQEDGKALAPTVNKLLGVLPANTDLSDYRAHQRRKHKL